MIIIIIDWLVDRERRQWGVSWETNTDNANNNNNNNNRRYQQVQLVQPQSNQNHSANIWLKDFYPTPAIGKNCENYQNWINLLTAGR